MRVLVADDEPMIRHLLVEVLEDAGFEVLPAADGSEAWALLQGPDQVDLLVTDLHMPGMDGIEVATWARQRQPTLPVLFVSGRPDLLNSSRPPLPYRCLSKPFSMHELATVVGELLQA